MDTVTLKLLTIIAEALLEDTLVREIKQLGARGYTVSSVRGEGTRGVRASEWEGYNVKIETLVSDETANRILEHLVANYFTLYAVVAYVENVTVVRSEKYV